MAGSFVNDIDLVLGDVTGLVLGGSSNDGEEGRWWVQFFALAPSLRQAQALHMWWAVASFSVGRGLVGSGFAVVMGARWDWTMEMVSLQFRLLLLRTIPPTERS